MVATSTPLLGVGRAPPLGLAYGKINRDWRLLQVAVRAGEGDKQVAYKAATEAKERFFQDLGISWAINTPYLKFYGF